MFILNRDLLNSDFSFKGLPIFMYNTPNGCLCFYEVSRPVSLNFFDKDRGSKATYLSDIPSFMWLQV